MKKLMALVLMVLFGVGVNRYIAAHKTELTTPVANPTQMRPLLSLPGTIYVAQQGAIYAYSDGNIPVELPLPGNLQWTQPHVLPDGSLLVVAHTAAYSDLYHVSATGQVIAQLTHNLVASKSNQPIQLNHWVFYPTTNADGSTVYASYDNPKPDFNASYAEDLSLWAGPLDGKLNHTRWSVPDQYTGGDVEVQPVPSGGIIYATYSIAPDNHVESVIGYQHTPSSAMVPLTQQSDDCNSPSLAPDGVTVAMICTADTQTARLEIAHLVSGRFDSPTVIVSNCLCNSPAWAPDGSGLLYIAPSDASGKFQLQWIKGAGTAAAQPSKPVTEKIDLDATSAPTWFMSASMTPTVSSSP